MPFDWATFGSAIAGALVGGAIAGYFALRSIDKNYKNQLKARSRKRREAHKRTVAGNT